MSEEYRFHWADYLTFVLTILSTCLIGVYFGVHGKGQNSTEKFLMAGRNMNIIPVASSIFVSLLSAILFIGDPVEVYYYGGIYWVSAISFIFLIPIAAHVFVPFYHKMNLVSLNEVLEMRYNKFVRVFCSAIGTVAGVIWFGIILYAPSISLSQVTGLQVEITIVACGILCTLYTTIGGMKGVLWADCLQMFIMFAGVVAVVVQGTMDVGGIGKVWEINEKGGRLNFNNFTPSPYVRNSFWIYLIGGFFRFYAGYITSQMCIQRYGTLNTVKEVQIAMYLNLPLNIIMISLISLMGLVMYAYYSGCDPLMAGKIQKGDQMVPLFIVEVLGFLPGLPGLFMACMFSASLSTLSSGFNGIAATTLKDFVVPLYKKIKQEDMDDSKQTITAKIIATVFGLLTTGFAIVILNLSSSIFAMGAKVVGAFGGPLAGVFTLVVLFPKLGTRTVVASYVITTAVCIWWAVGAQLLNVRFPILPISAAQCPVRSVHGAIESNNVEITNITLPNMYGMNDTTISPTFMNTTTTTMPIQDTEETDSFTVSDLYRLAPLLYTPFGCVSTIFVGLIIHLITWCFMKIRGRDFGTHPYEVNKEPVEDKSHSSKTDLEDGEIKL